jgi:hypothetical protein
MRLIKYTYVFQSSILQVEMYLIIKGGDIVQQQVTSHEHQAFERESEHDRLSCPELRHYSSKCNRPKLS